MEFYTNNSPRNSKYQHFMITFWVQKSQNEIKQDSNSFNNVSSVSQWLYSPPLKKKSLTWSPISAGLTYVRTSGEFLRGPSAVPPIDLNFQIKTLINLTCRLVWKWPSKSLHTQPDFSWNINVQKASVLRLKYPKHESFFAVHEWNKRKYTYYGL